MTGPDPADKKSTRATPAKAKAVSSDKAPVEATAEIVQPAAPAVTPAPVVAAAAPEPVAPAPAPAPAPATPAPAPAPEVAAAAQSAAPARFNTPDVAGAVDKAVDRLRTTLTVGEIVAGLGALIILVIAWAMFGFIFGHEGTWPGDLVQLLSIGLLVVLLIQNAHVHDFGPNYRLLVAGMCFALGILAVLSVLFQFRGLFDNRSFNIGGLTWWAGAWIATLGGFMVWREGR